MGETIDFGTDRSDPFHRALMFVHLVRRGTARSEWKFWLNMTETEQYELCQVLAASIRETEWTAEKLETRYKASMRARKSQT